MKHIFTLLSLIIVINVNAQSVKKDTIDIATLLQGRVGCGMILYEKNYYSLYSSKDSSVINGATIQSKQYTTVSDEYGRFRLDYFVTDSVTFSSIGYNNKTIARKEVIKLKTIYLDEKPNELDTVVIVRLASIRCSRYIGCGGSLLQLERQDTLNINQLIETPLNQSKIKLYPNPTSNTVRFSDISNIEEIIVSDFNGKQLQRILNRNNKSLSINVSSYPAATYIVTYITKDKKRTTVKLVVVH